MIIDKILNNNVITVKNDKNLEKVIMGRGIAFQKKVGDNVDESKIEKVFTITDKNTSNHLQELLVNIPLDYLKITEEIVTYGKTYLGKRINDMIYVSLADLKSERSYHWQPYHSSQCGKMNQVVA